VKHKVIMMRHVTLPFQAPKSSALDFACELIVRLVTRVTVIITVPSQNSQEQLSSYPSANSPTPVVGCSQAENPKMACEVNTE
jgi:hypothetical protein